MNQRVADFIYPYYDVFFVHLKKWPSVHDKFKRLQRLLGIRNSLVAWLADFSEHHPEIMFVQVGANDGIRDDPIREFVVRNAKWRGLLIEPIPSLFTQLRKNYQYCNQNGRLIFENVAISEYAGALRLWRLKESQYSNYPDHVQGMVSFERDNFVGAVKPEDLDAALTHEDVPCIDFANLLGKHHISEIDLLLIDVEGYEEGVLKRFPFERFRPAAIVLEVCKLSAESRQNVNTLLAANRYRITEHGEDVVAIYDGTPARDR
jgi:FkbM family methyltransferase